MSTLTLPNNFYIEPQLYDLKLLQYCSFFYSNWKQYSQRGIQQCYEELYYLKKILGDRKFFRMFEIGVDDGGTTFLYSNLFGAQNSIYYACDTQIKSHIHDISEKTKHISNSNINIVPIEMNSNNCDLTHFDFVHIDGDHDYKSVSADFHRFWPRIVSGGVCLLHDSCLWPGVIDFRLSYIEKYYDCITIKGHSLFSGDFGVPNPYGYKLGTGITIVFKN